MSALFVDTEALGALADRMARTRDEVARVGPRRRRHGRTSRCDDLTSALRQTAVYAVDSTGSAISPSSADVAIDACRGRTRTV